MRVPHVLKEELFRRFWDIGVSTDNLAPLAAEVWMLWQVSKINRRSAYLHVP